MTRDGAKALSKTFVLTVHFKHVTGLSRMAGRLSLRTLDEGL